MGQQGKRNIFDDLTNKLSNVSIPDTGTGIDLDAYKNEALSKLKGSDLGNLFKGDSGLTSNMTSADAFNIFANKIAGSTGVDFKALGDEFGAKALPSESSLDADFFKQAVDKMKSVSIKEGMVFDDQEAIQKFNEMSDKIGEISASNDFGAFNNMINENEGTIGVDYVGDAFGQLQNFTSQLSPESSNVGVDSSDKFARTNVLHNYEPYNYLLSLSCLNVDQFHSNNHDGVLIAKSGGGGGATADGLDYYIENLVIRNTVAPTEISGTATAYQILFDVVEPYGVKFIDTLIATAAQQGYLNQFNAIYNLKIEFKGYNDQNVATNNVPNSTRNIPIHIYNVDMQVDAGVTTYRIQAAPAQYAALNNVYNFVSEDINCYGNTVGEIINSFFERYTEVQLRKQKDGLVITPDEYELIAPGSEDVLTSPVGYDKNASSNRVKNISILRSDGPPGQTGRKVTIAKGSSIIDFINKVVVESEYYRNKFDDNNNLIDFDGDGFTTSLRIFTKLEIKDVDNGSGRPAYKLKYIVRTQRVSKQHFNYKSNEDLISNVKASRTYDYLYTGQNKDVLDFDINYKFAYFQPIPYFDASGNDPDNEKLSGESDASNSDKSKSASGASGGVTDTNVIPVNNTIGKLLPDQQAKGLGMATVFDQILQNPNADLLVANLNILGDPYWIEQKSVLANDMSGKSEGGSNVYSDNSVLPDDTEIFIRLNFRVPSDVNDAKGLFNIDNAAFFKGIYKVFLCESRFEGGIFMQNLQMIRMKAQGIDYEKYKPYSKAGMSNKKAIDGPTVPNVWPEFTVEFGDTEGPVKDMSEKTLTQAPDKHPLLKNNSNYNTSVKKTIEAPTKKYNNHPLFRNKNTNTTDNVEVHPFSNSNNKLTSEGLYGKQHNPRAPGNSVYTGSNGNTTNTAPRNNSKLPFLRGNR